ncbi:MAG: hypothetical protein KC592_05330 [Nitrospira sp.]|nr:hypothetical protein [Nitrospira sp.]
MRLSKIVFLLCFGLLILFLFGCQNWGKRLGIDPGSTASYSFLLQYKKDVRCFYLPVVSMSQGAHEGADECKNRTILTAETAKERKGDADKYLPPIYRSNLPFSLTDQYDFRTSATPLRRGDPLNIIINRVHLKDNGEWIWLNTGEIAVVVSVHDGKPGSPKHVIVAYETNIGNNVDIPISNLLAYSNDTYLGEPIRIEITVFDLDQTDNDFSASVLSLAAGAGKTVMPGLSDLAAQVGTHLISLNQDDVLVKFAFQLYPWKVGNVEMVSGEVGVPKVIAGGTYILVNADVPLTLKYAERIHINWDFTPYKIKDYSWPNIWLAQESDDCIGQKEPSNYGIRPWPIPLSCEKPPKDGSELEALKMSYLILTIDDTPLSSAAQIISRVNALNRESAGLAAEGTSGSNADKAALEQLDGIKSMVIRVSAEKRFFKHKTDPESLTILTNLIKGDSLNKEDKEATMALISKLLPEIPTKGTAGDEKLTLLQWYEEIKGFLKYEPKAGRYKCDVLAPYECATPAKPSKKNASLKE